MADVRKPPAALDLGEGGYVAIGNDGITRMEWSRIKGPMDWLDTVLVYRGDTLADEYLAWQLRGIKYEIPDDIDHF